MQIPEFPNTFLVIRDGEIIAEYRKPHLYDAFSARESDVVLPGDALPPIVDIDGLEDRRHDLL